MTIYEAVVHPIAAFVYCSLIARRRLQAPDGTRLWTPPTMTQTHLTDKLKLFYFISWWNHAWN